MTLDASWTSCRVRLELPEMLMRMPCAPWIELSFEKAGWAMGAGFAAIHGTVSFQSANSGTHHGVALAMHDGFSRRPKVTVDDTGNGDDVRDALHRLTKDVVGDAEKASKESSCPALDGWSIKRSLGITMTVVNSANEFLKSLLRLQSCGRLPSKKANGFVTTATLKAPNSLAERSNYGARRRWPVPPPRPDVMENHVRAFQRFR